MSVIVEVDCSFDVIEIVIVALVVAAEADNFGYFFVVAGLIT